MGKGNIKKTISVLLVIFALSLRSQITYEKLYTDTIWPKFSYNGGLSGNIAKLKDSGYVYINSIENGNLLGRLTSSGNPVWTKKIYDSLFNLQPNITVSPSNFIYVSFVTRDSLTINGTVTTLIKLNASGNLIWNKTYGNPSTNSEWITDLVVTGTSIFLCGGGGIGINGGALIQKLDTNGNLIWSKLMNGDGNSYFTNIKKSSNNDIILSGQTNSSTGDFVCIMRLDTNGVVKWNYDYASPDYCEIWPQGLNEDAEGNILVTGFVDSIPGSGLNPPGYWDIFVLRVNSSGNVKWAKLYGGNDYDEGWSVFPTKDKGYTIIAEPESYGMLSRIAMIRLDSLGNAQWTKLYGSAVTGGYPNGCVENSDAGYTIFATDADYSWLAPMHLIRTDSLGNIPCPSTTVNINQAAFTPVVSSTLTIASVSGMFVYSPVINNRVLSDYDYCITSSVIEEMTINGITLLYPSPFNSEINIKALKNVNTIKLKIMSITGEIVFSSVLNSGNNLERPVSLGHLASGIYLAEIEIDHIKRVEKIVKQ